MTRKVVKKRHKPTRESRATVINLKMWGHPNDKIARFLNISITTLKRLYGDDLDDAATRLQRKAAAGLEAKLNEGDMAAIQLVWRLNEYHKPESTGGTNITINNGIGDDMKRLQAMLKDQAQTLEQDKDGVYKDMENE